MTENKTGMTGILTRDVTRQECPWLGRDLAKGEEVYEKCGLVYGVIDIPIVGEPCEAWPFFELPDDVILWNK